MLLAHSGESVRAPLQPDGSFALTVPQRLVSKFATAKRGRGSTLHVLTNGEYAGPVLLRKSGNTKGFMRLSPTVKGTVRVGTVMMAKGFAIARAKANMVDSSTTVRLRGGTPVSALSTQTSYGEVFVSSFVTISGDNATLGADADKDGLPNLADPDMNGDGLLDAAQPESTTDYVGLASDLVLEGRPNSSVGFAKILDLESSVQTNSNANPSVTAEQIRAALAVGLKIQISRINLTDATRTQLLIDCRKLTYCEPGSKSMVRGAPGDPIDGKSLYELQDSSGLIVMPIYGSEGRLTVYPGVASAAEGLLAGDVFELIMRVGGVTVSSEAKVVTSSVATPMALVSLGGSPITSPRGEIAVAVSSLSAMNVTFYRPQAFASGSTSALVDRGGLTYFVSIWPNDKSNTGYMCSVKHYGGLSSTLLKSPTSLPPVEQGVFDSEVKPTSNGTKLSFALDARACLADQTNAKHTFISGSEWRLELMGQDSDGNKVNVSSLFKVP